MAMPMPANIHSHYTHTTAGRSGAKSTNYPTEKAGYAGAVMSHALTKVGMRGMSRKGYK